MESPPGQLINETRVYNPQALADAISNLQATSLKDYFAISIIGGQNSGKSTLLNELFSTNFAVLKSKQKVRTTRGVIVSSMQNILIFDVEGNDSQDRVAEQNYQKMVSSFALTTSHALLINIFSKSLGQYVGSQYQSLKIIMEICIGQFRMESPKNIIYVVRDFNVENDDQSQVTRKIKNDVEAIWAKLEKPEEYNKFPKERFFIVDVICLRKFGTKEFKGDVLKLRERLTHPKLDSYLLSKQNIDLNVPIEDFKTLVEMSWQTILDSKKLNLPEAKDQLSNYRCSQILEETKRQFQYSLTTTTKPDFSTKAALSQSILNTTDYGTLIKSFLASFLEKVHYYSKKVVEGKTAELKEYLERKIQMQISNQIQQRVKWIEEIFLYKVGRSTFNNAKTMQEELTQVGQDLISKLSICLNKMNYEIAERAIYLQKVQVLLKNALKEAMAQKTKMCIESIKRDTSRIMRILGSEVLKNGFGMALWEKCQELFNMKKVEWLQIYSNQINWSRGCLVTAQQLDEVESQMRSQVVENIQHELEKTLLDKSLSFFTDRFTRDAQGVRYNLKVLTEQQLSSIFQSAREQTICLVTKINEVQVKRAKRVMIIQCLQEKEELFNGSWLSNLIEQLDRRMIAQYDNTLRRKTEAEMKEVPWYLIVVIVYFVYDDLWFPKEQYPIIHDGLLFLGYAALLIIVLGQAKAIKEIAAVINGKIMEKWHKMTENKKGKHKE